MQMTNSVVRNQKVDSLKKELSKKLRKEMTEAEKIFWEAARNKKLGIKFRRQQIIDGFIADFFCPELNLAIEIDGKIHESQEEYDNLRDKIIASRKIEIIRIRNDDIIKGIEEIKRYVNSRLHIGEGI